MILILDFETNGLLCTSDILQVGLIVVENGKITKVEKSLLSSKGRV